MSKADELYDASIEYSNKINAEDDLTSWSLSDAFIAGYNYRQSEIDTIKNSVKIYNEVIDDQKREIDKLRADLNTYRSLLDDRVAENIELKAEVERLKGSKEDRLFHLANEFAGDETGHIAVKLHAIHNLINQQKK